MEGVEDGVAYEKEGAVNAPLASVPVVLLLLVQLHKDIQVKVYQAALDVWQVGSWKGRTPSRNLPDHRRQMPLLTERIDAAGSGTFT